MNVGGMGSLSGFVVICCWVCSELLIMSSSGLIVMSVYF